MLKTKEYWIILRLLLIILNKQDREEMLKHPQIRRTVSYLIDTYGSDRTALDMHELKQDAIRGEF